MKIFGFDIHLDRTWTDLGEQARIVLADYLKAKDDLGEIVTHEKRQKAEFARDILKLCEEHNQYSRKRERCQNI